MGRSVQLFTNFGHQRDAAFLRPCSSLREVRAVRKPMIEVQRTKESRMYLELSADELLTTTRADRKR